MTMTLKQANAMQTKIHDEKTGRFLKGKPPGPGRPKGSQADRIRLELLSHYTNADWKKLARRIMTDALSDDITKAVPARNQLIKIVGLDRHNGLKIEVDDY